MHQSVGIPWLCLAYCRLSNLSTCLVFCDRQSSDFHVYEGTLYVWLQFFVGEPGKWGSFPDIPPPPTKYPPFPPFPPRVPPVSPRFPSPLVQRWLRRWRPWTPPPPPLKLEDFGGHDVALGKGRHRPAKPDPPGVACSTYRPCPYPVLHPLLHLIPRRTGKASLETDGCSVQGLQAWGWGKGEGRVGEKGESAKGGIGGGGGGRRMNGQTQRRKQT